MKTNILEIYMNYLYAIRIQEEYGDIYGDTDDIIRYYEGIIKKDILRNDCINKKIKIYHKSSKG